MVSPPVLQMPDFAKEFVVECDVLRKGLDAILMQENKIIAYSSLWFKGESFASISL